jgi:UDP-N-acetylglucosamine 2-epimerase (non-hydrolysing)
VAHFDPQMKLVSVVGTRPNFMKLAPIARVLAKRTDVDHVVIHTGQHYDATMSDAFFRDLGIPAPQHSLAVGSGSHAAQTAAVLARIEPVFETEQPDLVLVYGDVNSTVAAALAAAKMNLKVAHVEAGLRSRDRTMPEEINRLVTDQLADLLFAPSPDAVDNLRAEGVAAEKIHFVGNIMIDVLVAALPEVQRMEIPARHGVRDGHYVVATLHRPANVDDPARLRELAAALDDLSRQRPVLFPVHPRTRERMRDLDIVPSRTGALQLLDPIGYSEMLGLVAAAEFVITDSGGLQEETTWLGVPCLTVRPNTERPITCTLGTNRLVAPERAAILSAARDAVASRGVKRAPIARWDGHTAERIAAVVCDGAAFDRWDEPVARAGTLLGV